MLSANRFRFLNQEMELSCKEDWQSERMSKLWTYNLHYFDDLNADSAHDRIAWHSELIRRWIRDNPPAHGVGWEPYPLSLRIINWIKWAFAGGSLEPAARQSLAIQTRHLRKRLEYHLLGNHLFANAKALVFAGCFFEGEEAENWLRCGMRILERQIPEQVLADGGHFERSTMYHALAFEDMLDLANLAKVFPLSFRPWAAQVSGWPEVIQNMGSWLKAMCHPDQEIGFFNDAALGIAPPTCELLAYASRLGFDWPEDRRAVVHLEPSGYVRACIGDAMLLIDVAPVGPDYLPGHAHADTLSFEFSLFGQRILVNSGTSRYGLGSEREAERGTGAHSTVQIDGRNSSEVWGGFRVARRAYPSGVRVHSENEAIVIEASHTGYHWLPGRPVHRRRWVLGKGKLEVHDTVSGGFSEAISRMYFHPVVGLTLEGSGGQAIWRDKVVRWWTDSQSASLESSAWHPEFGVSLPNRCIQLLIQPAKVAASCCFILDWT
ncbi:alginate lyase family protein [Geothrix sp. PMB-07]|uniref:heparinase II/III family protein n=1 Tax=Geothrix sp. PMB-07 TaxID=3068640 RepID=UPI0027412422|nr:alginate lyase family protein [Geothrix sp. PMB-07]WLT31315.1 alginate lyase family protein [Geothrix sp. PMB-07]